MRNMKWASLILCHNNQKGFLFPCCPPFIVKLWVFVLEKWHNTSPMFSSVEAERKDGTHKDYITFTTPLGFFFGFNEAHSIPLPSPQPTDITVFSHTGCGPCGFASLFCLYICLFIASYILTSLRYGCNNMQISFWKFSRFFLSAGLSANSVIFKQHDERPSGSVERRKREKTYWRLIKLKMPLKR